MLKNSLTRKLFHILLFSILSIILPICSNASEPKNASETEDFNLSEFSEIFGLDENEPIETLDYPQNNIREDLGYRDAGKVGDTYFEAIRPGKNGFVGWLLKRKSDGSISVGVGTLARDEETGSCKVYTTKYVALPVSDEEKEVGVQYLFVRPKPNGFGSPMPLDLDEGHRSKGNMIVSFTPKYTIEQCANFHPDSQKNHRKIEEIKVFFEDENLIAISPARRNDVGYYAFQKPEQISLWGVYIGIIGTDFDAYSLMLGSPVFFYNEVTNKYEVLGLISTANHHDCKAFKPTSCKTNVLMLSRKRWVQRDHLQEEQ